MATMPNVAFQKGQGVDVCCEGEWWKGVIAEVDMKSERPYKVKYDANGACDEEWFGPDALRAH
jgi:hypothetical protein